MLGVFFVLSLFSAEAGKRCDALTRSTAEYEGRRYQLPKTVADVLKSDFSSLAGMSPETQHAVLAYMERMFASRLGFAKGKVRINEVFEALGVLHQPRGPALKAALQSGAFIPEAIVVVHQHRNLQPETASYLATQEAPVIALSANGFPILHDAFLERADLVMPSTGGELRGEPNIGRAILLGGFCEVCLSETIDHLVRRFDSSSVQQEIVLYSNLIYFGSVKNPRLLREEVAGNSAAWLPDVIRSAELDLENPDVLERPQQVRTPWGQGIQWVVPVKVQPSRLVRITVVY